MPTLHAGIYFGAEHIMERRSCIVVCFALIVLRSSAQVLVTSGSYTQNFGTTDVTSWTNNSTYLGWYQNQGSFVGHLNVTAAAPVNTGGFYTYECSGLNDQKIGSRGSGTAPATNIRYGVVLRNQTGFSIQSLRLTYRGYQMSLAQNGNVVNRSTFDYVVSAGLPGINAAATAAVPALNFTQVQNSAVAGASQINGYPCTRSTLISGCISLASPLINNSYILLRWTDIDDSNNDHHMAIDDVQVDFDLSGNSCTLFLPVELLDFGAVQEGSQVRLAWTTGSEHDNDHFFVERSPDGRTFEPIAVVPGAGNGSKPIAYGAIDPWPLKGVSYYRLRQVDHNGTSDLSSTVAVSRAAEDQMIIVAPAVSLDGRMQIIADAALVGASYEILDAAGRRLLNGQLTSLSTELDLGSYGAGVYLLHAQHGARVATARVVVGVQ